MLHEAISPMLAYPSDPFDSPRHIYEIKWDGTRCLLFFDGRSVRLQNRRFLDITSRYPEFRRIHKEIRAKNVILDGELVALSGGVPDFKKLQQREHLYDPFRARMMSREVPVTYAVFDLLYLNGRRCTQLPLLDRKGLIEGVIEDIPHVIESQYIEEEGKTFFIEAVKQGFEGVMAKAAHSPYLIGKRSRYWLKIKPRNSAICFVVGYTEGERGRSSYFGSLALANREDGKWVYRGKVGSGFTGKEVETISARLAGLRTDSPPSPGMKRIRGIRWTRPELKCEVFFQEETEKGHFRAPVFRRIVG